jgi:small neutral amino acid transporter SnatA (MarC family)
MEAYLPAFIPLFVAIDVFGVLPIYVGITQGRSDAQRRTLAMQAIATAFTVSVIFLVTGKVVFARADAITHVLGKAGSQAVAKVAALFMSAIAVMMIRNGIQGMLQGH